MRTDIVPDYLKEFSNLSTMRPPSIILREQAESLRKNTNGLLHGSVASYTSDGSTTIRHTFYLVAPSLESLAYSLFYAWHGDQPYPVSILQVGHKQSNAIECKNETDFEEQLYEIFHSKQTEGIIRNLLAQALIVIREAD